MKLSIYIQSKTNTLENSNICNYILSFNNDKISMNYINYIPQYSLNAMFTTLYNYNIVSKKYFKYTIYPELKPIFDNEELVNIRYYNKTTKAAYIMSERMKNLVTFMNCKSKKVYDSVLTPEFITKLKNVSKNIDYDFE